VPAQEISRRPTTRFRGRYGFEEACGRAAWHGSGDHASTGRPYDPTPLASVQPKFAPAKVVIKDGEKETIAVGKTKYECKVVTITRTYTIPAKNVILTYEFKTWTSSDAPLGGLVKMEMNYGDDAGRQSEEITITLVDSGKEK
jgi:hypothetical protein